MRTLNFPLSIASPAITQLGSANCPPVATYTTNATRFQNVVVQGNYAYVAGTGSTAGVNSAVTLAIYDVTDPTNIIFKSSIITFASAWTSGPSYMNASYSIKVSGNFCYVASAGGTKFYIVDVTDPSNPFNTGAVQLSAAPGSTYSCDVHGNYAYLATQNKGLTVVDCTNKSAPTQTFQEGGTLNKSVGVWVSGNYCFTTNFQTAAPWTVRYLKTWDISTPQTPSLVNTYTLPAGTKPGTVSVYGNYAYVADLNTNSIQIVDITNPLTPVYKSSMSASAAFNVANNAQIYGNYAYIGSGQNAGFGGAIDVFDITNKSAPVLIYTYKSNIAVDVFGATYLHNNIIYIPDYGIAANPNTYLKTFTTLTNFSNAVQTTNLSNVSAQISGSTVSSTGTYQIQGSNDLLSPTNFTDIPGASLHIGGVGTYLIPVIDFCYQWVRLSYTGIGPSNVVLKASEL